MNKVIVSSQKQKNSTKQKRKETIFSSVVNPKRKEIPLSLKNQNPFQVIEGSHLIIFTKKKTLKSPNGFLRRQTPLEDRKLPIHAVR